MSVSPKLRFPEFDGEWRDNKLKDNISLISGQHLSPEEYSADGEFPYFTGPTDFTNDVSEVKKWTSISRSVAASGSILITVKGSGVGEMAQAQLDNVVIGRQLMSIEGNKASTGFLYQYLLKKRQLMKALASGNMIPGLSRADLFSISVSIPPLPEQQKIASFLSSVDKKIDLLRQKKDALELYKKDLMQEIFSQEIRFKQDDGSDFPDWEEVALGDVLCERKEFSEKNKGYPHISLTVEGVVPKSERYNRDFLVKDDDLKKYKVTRLGDICYNPANLKFGVIDVNRWGDGIFSPIYVTFEAKCASLDYVGYLVKHASFINKVRKFEQGTVYERQAVHPEHFIQAIIALPSLPEQEKIADFLSAVDTKIQNTSSQIEQMESFKKGLLQQMFV